MEIFIFLSWKTVSWFAFDSGEGLIIKVGQPGQRYHSGNGKR